MTFSAVGFPISSWEGKVAAGIVAAGFLTLAIQIVLAIWFRLKKRRGGGTEQLPHLSSLPFAKLRNKYERGKLFVTEIA
jgi:hypothetical protein